MDKKKKKGHEAPIQIELIPGLSSSHNEDLLDGRDELNLAEFPICSLSGRQTTEDLTLAFKDSEGSSLREQSL